MRPSKSLVEWNGSCCSITYSCIVSVEFWTYLVEMCRTYMPANDLVKELKLGGLCHPQINILKINYICKNLLFATVWNMLSLYVLT
jgi:hypothetical protein